MSSARTSRFLDLNFENLNGTSSNNDQSEAEARPNMDELRSLFREEIDLIITSEKQRIEHELKKEFDAEISLLKQTLRKELDESIEGLKEDRKKLDKSITSIKKSYQEKISDDIGMLDELVIELTMKCLYKIIGDGDNYRDLIEKNVREILEKKSADINALIKVSEAEMKFMKSQFSDASWIDCLRLDEKLSDGEMVLDDGIRSLYEIGFVNQLDVLRAAFIKTLRENHAR